MKLRKIVGNPLSIIIIVSVLVMVILAAFSSVLPAASVVESGSMQHSHTWTAGTINTGDLIFEKGVNDPVRDIVTYVQGRTSNFSTYGDFGDVMLYNGVWNFTIVHRAMFYLDWNGTTPVVQGYNGQEWINITPDQIVVKDVGFSHRNLVVSLFGLAGHSGFITMGDNNLATSTLNITTAGGFLASDQDIFGFLPISPENVSAIATGHIPWVGLIKLNIMRVQGDWQHYNDVPENSYLYLALSFAGVISIIGSALYVLARNERKKAAQNESRRS